MKSNTGKNVLGWVIAFAGGLLITKLIMNAKSKNNSNSVVAGNNTTAPMGENGSTTPISGSSDDILSQLDESSANELKDELKQ